MKPETGTLQLITPAWRQENFTTSAPLMAIDACPMEGFEPAEHRSSIFQPKDWLWSFAAQQAIARRTTHTPV